MEEPLEEESKNQILEEIEDHQYQLIENYVSYNSIKEESADYLDPYLSLQSKFEELMKLKGVCKETLEIRNKIYEFQNCEQFRNKMESLHRSKSMIKRDYEIIQRLSNSLLSDSKIKDEEQKLLNSMKRLEDYQKDFDISSKFVEYIKNELEKNRTSSDFLDIYHKESQKRSDFKMNVKYLTREIEEIQNFIKYLKENVKK